jgi:hypothetical protein
MRQAFVATKLIEHPVHPAQRVGAEALVQRDARIEIGRSFVLLGELITRKHDADFRLQPVSGPTRIFVAAGFVTG